MKQKLLLKSMLLLFALIAGSSSVWAVEPDLTLDLTSAWTPGDKDGDESVFTKTISETTYTIKGQGGTNFKFSSGYFIFGKSGAYIKLPTVDYDVEKIVVIGNGGGSSAVKMNIFVGETAVSTETTGCGEGSNTGTASTLEYTIAADKQTAGTQYILKVTSSHNAQITYIKYYKKSSGGGNSVATPTFDPAGGTYTSTQNVTISCATGGATIRYTTNGDDPTESSTLYSSAISVTKSGTVVKAKAFKDGMAASNVASTTYTIKPNKPYVSAAGATVTINGNSGLDFYYTTDNSAPTKSSNHYTAPFDLNADCTIKAIAYDANDNASDVTSYSFKYFPLNPKNINSGYYEKVTDVNTLENGDAILIVYETDNVAMSTTQNTNNRGSESVSISNSTINSPSASVQKLVLVKNTEEIKSTPTDVYYFYTGSGYLYAASSSSNYLRTEDTPDGNARATISISNEDATITFTGSNTHNILKFNNASNQKIFSCYSSGQQAVQIYKEVAHSETLTPGKTYTTLTSAYNLDFTSVSSDLKAYIATEVSGGSVLMTQVNKVPANTGLVLKATTPGSAVYVPVFDGTGADDVTANKMKGSATETTHVDEKAGYILSNGVFQPSSGGDLPEGKAYLNIAYSPAAPILNLGFDDATGIESIAKSQELTANGQYYNLAGQRVAQPTKGLYIVNGKKVIVR